MLVRAIEGVPGPQNSSRSMGAGVVQIFWGEVKGMPPSGVQFDPEHLRIAAKLRGQERRRLRRQRLGVLAAFGLGLLIWFALVAMSLLVVWLVLFKWEF